MLKLLLILTSISSINLWAQTKISGVLLERGTRTLLKEVNLFILPHKLKATTNDKGEFEFFDVPEGDFDFVVNNSGFLRLNQKGSTKISSYTLYLEKEFYGVFETTVTAIADKTDVSLKRMSQKEFLKAPGAQEDPLKAIQNLPGIANQAFSAQVVIQGSEPDDTRYTLNGHEIPIAFHFGGLSSIIMPQAVEGVDFLASGYGPEYGRALGGIINLETRAPKTDRLHAMAFVDLYNAGGLVEGPIDETSSFFLSARQSYIGQVLAKVAEGRDEFDLTVAPTFSDIFMDYHKKLNDKDQFSFLAIRSKDELQFIVKEPINNDPFIRGDFYQRTEFYRVIPRFNRRLSEKQSLDFSIGYGDNNILAEIGDNYFDLKSSTLSARSELKTIHSKTYTSFVGLDAQQISYDVGLRLPQRDPRTGASSNEIRQATIEGADSQNAIYVRNQLQLMNEKLQLAPNLRLEHFSATDETHLMPRVSLAYKLTPSLTTSIAAGLYYQAPQNGEASSEFGNPTLKSEKATHLTLGLEKDFRKGSSNGLVANFDFFTKKLDDLIVRTSAKNSAGKPKVYDNNGEGTIYGLQALLKYNYNEYNAILAYTYLNSSRKEAGMSEYPSEYDQTHNLNLIGSYETPRWNYSTRLRYVTGRPLTPVIGSIFDSDSDRYIPLRGAFLSERYDPFFQLDFRIDRKWIYNTWILSAYLDIQNVTNNKNVQSISYNYDYSDSVKTSALPLLPIFGVKGEF
jgi:outer membrane receptor protein involved in Fe transport